MKLKYDFEIVNVAGEIMAVPVGEGLDGDNPRFVMKLNETASDMMKYIIECSNEEEVLNKLSAEYPEDDRAEIKLHLDRFMEKLTKEGVI